MSKYLVVIFFIIINFPIFCKWDFIPACDDYQMMSCFVEGDTLYAKLSSYNTSVSEFSDCLSAYKEKQWQVELKNSDIYAGISNDSIRNYLETKCGIGRYYKAGSKYYVNSRNSLRDHLLEYNKSETLIFDSIYFNQSNLLKAYYQILALAFNSENEVYMIVMEDLFENDYHICKLKNERLEVIYSYNSNNYIQRTFNLNFDKQDNLWAIFTDTIISFNNDILNKKFSMKEMPVSGNLSGGYFLTIQFDNNGNSWAISNVAGIYKYDGIQWETDSELAEYLHSMEPKFQISTKYPLLIDSKGSLFVFSIYIHKYSDGKWEHKLVPNFNPNENSLVYSASNNYPFMDRDDRLWFFDNGKTNVFSYIYTNED